MASADKKPTAIVVGKHFMKLPRHSMSPISTFDFQTSFKDSLTFCTGAGVGGIATAARLSKAGYSVTVLEKNGFTGGRCSLINHSGYRFDQGPSLLLLPKLFQETFHDLSTSLEAEDVRLLKCDPNYNMWFGDGESFELSSDTSVMKREIEKWEGKDGFERYLAWLAEAHRHYEISVREVLHKNFTSVFNLLRPSFLRHLVALHPFAAIYGAGRGNLVSSRRVPCCCGRFGENMREVWSQHPTQHRCVLCPHVSEWQASYRRPTFDR